MHPFLPLSPWSVNVFPGSLCPKIWALWQNMRYPNWVTFTLDSSPQNHREGFWWKHELKRFFNHCKRQPWINYRIQWFEKDGKTPFVCLRVLGTGKGQTNLKCIEHEVLNYTIFTMHKSYVGWVHTPAESRWERDKNVASLFSLQSCQCF